MYGILGFRTHTLNDEISIGFLEAGADSYWGPDKVTHIQQNNKFSSSTFGLGFLHVRKNASKVFGGSQFINGYLYFDSNSFDWEGYEFLSGYNGPVRFDRDGTVDVIDWNIGISYGFRFFEGYNISSSLEYSFGSMDSYEFSPDYSSYLSFSISLGGSRRTKLGHLGVSAISYPNHYFAGSSGPSGSAIEIRTEIPFIIYGGIVFLGILVVDPVLGSEILSNLNSSASGSGKSKYCHVFGKIQYVDYGEDYKVKFVNSSGNLDVKFVEYGADSPGEWKVVEYGEDFKIRIVEYGEDFTIRRVQYGAGCN